MTFAHMSAVGTPGFPGAFARALSGLLIRETTGAPRC